MTTSGKRIISSAKQALAFAKGEKNNGCTVHIPSVPSLASFVPRLSSVRRHETEEDNSNNYAPTKKS